MEFNLQILDIYPSIEEIKSNPNDNLIFTVASNNQNEHIFNFEDLINEKIKINLNSNEIKYNFYKNEKLIGNGNISINNNNNNNNNNNEIKWITVNNVIKNNNNKNNNKNKFKFNNKLK